MLFVAQRMPEEPWHLVLRSDEGGWVQGLCGATALPNGWWRRRIRPIMPESVPDGVCSECLEGVEDMRRVNAEAVEEMMGRLDEVIRSVQGADGL